MITVRSRMIFLVSCLAEVIFLLVSQIVGNTALLLVCLGTFLALVVFAAIKGMVVPILLFFMPFAPIIKPQPGTISFFTIALVATYVIYFVLGSRNINIYHWIPGLCLIATALVVKTFHGYAIENSFLLFSVSLLIVPLFTRELGKKYDFYWLTVFFALGIIIAAITAKYLVVFPSITRYISTNIAFGFIRRSGYYGDPNFYSAHITAALSGLLVLFLNNDKRKRLIVTMLLLILLVYCGLLSVSKSFMLVTVSLFVVWFVEFLFIKGKVSSKLLIIFTFLTVAIFTLSSTVFTDLIGDMISRFGSLNNLSDFTTGRTEIWMSYLNEFVEKPVLLFFGQGLSSELVNGYSSHNTLIQAVYQFGLFGCIFLIGWILCCIRTLLSNTKIAWLDLPQVFLLMLGVFGPWMALDLLFFDEFFLMIVYACGGMSFIADNNKIHTLKSV